jgi:hypothetical protein
MMRKSRFSGTFHSESAEKAVSRPISSAFSRARMYARTHAGDHVADVVCNERSALDFENIEDACNVAALRFLVVAAGRLGREPHSAQVGNDHRVIGRQIFGKRHPHITGLAISVQQHYRWTRAADTHIKLRDARTPSCLRGGSGFQSC